MARKRLLAPFVGHRGEVFDGCFLCFKSRSAPPFSVERFIDKCFNAFPVTLLWPGHPRGKIIHESDCSSVAIDLSLHEVYVKEEK